MQDRSAEPPLAPAAVEPLNGPHPVRRGPGRAETHLPYHPPPDGPTVIHAEDSFVVVDKPAGLLAVPGIGEDKQDCVRSRVAALFPHATGPMTCHRLDLATSGLLVLGLTPKAQRTISMQFESRNIDKRYVALVQGHLAQEAGEISVPVRKDMVVRPLMLADYFEGKEAVSRYRVLAREQWGGRPVTRVEMEPITGRTHQLRVHAAHPRVTTIGTPGPDHTPGLNAPIVGDDLYGGLLAPRLMLHAAMLTLYHPDTGKRMSFRAPDPF